MHDYLADSVVEAYAALISMTNCQKVQIGRKDYDVTAQNIGFATEHWLNSVCP